MNGLELARRYYREAGRPSLEQRLPGLLPRMAVGLAGEGSDCFGFDDALSRDHDWGPAFCIWLEEEDYRRFGPAVQEVYDSLPGAFLGFGPRRQSPQGGGRVGCLPIGGWYRRYTGTPGGPGTLEQWRRAPEAFLAVAVNGEVFCDPHGRFSAIRRRLLAFYPEDLRIKKLAARAAAMAQAGQYNYPRCLARGELVAARLALAEFTRAAMSMAYLLDRRYAPFYKWMHRGLGGLRSLPHLAGQLDALARVPMDQGAVERIGAICLDASKELLRQGLIDRRSEFLLDCCADLMGRIQDPILRQSHWMEE